MFDIRVGDKVKLWNMGDNVYVVTQIHDAVKLRIEGEDVGGFWCDKAAIQDWLNGQPDMTGTTVIPHQDVDEDEIEEENPCIAGLDTEEPDHGDGSRWDEI